MVVGKVVGSVVATRKNERLLGNKFMVVEPLENIDAPAKKIIAIDNITDADERKAANNHHSSIIGR